MNNIISVKSDSAPSLSWRKGKVEKLIHGDDNLVRGADVRVYQDNLGKNSYTQAVTVAGPVKSNEHNTQ